MIAETDTTSHYRTMFDGHITQVKRIALPFSRVHLTRPVSSESDVESTISAIQKLILPWLQRKADRPLPDHAWDGKDFDLRDLDLGAQPTEAVSFEGTWAARNDDSKNIDGRTFVTEIIVTADMTAVHFGVNLTVVEWPNRLPVVRTVPRFVRRVAIENGFLIDGKLVSMSPWIVDNDDDVQQLVDLLVDESRKHPVCAISLPEESRDLADALLDAEGIQRRVAGSSHVVVVTGPASTVLASQLGERLSVFRGAVRTYEPDFDPHDWSPGRHRLALARSIANWEGGNASFADFLVDNLLKLTAYKPRMQGDLPSYLEVKQKFQDKTLTQDDMNSTLQNRIETLQKQLEEQQDVFGPVYEEAIHDKEEAQRELWGLRARVEQLEKVSLDSNAIEQELVIPSDFNALDEWAGMYLDGRGVVLTKKAIKAAKDSPFENVELAYRALLLLRDYYVPMKRRESEEGADAYQKYSEERELLSLEDGSAASAASAGQHGKEYYVRYNGREMLLNQHLRRGSVHDPKRTFALYFCWDDETRQVIVGSLPEHLTTAQS